MQKTISPIDNKVYIDTTPANITTPISINVKFSNQEESETLVRLRDKMMNAI